jgi:DNA-binding LacI/PurR family transcriptional regulator
MGGVPVVFMDRYIPGTPADAVMTRQRDGGAQATDFLIQSGCRRNLCISFSDEASSALERMEGFRQAHHDHNLPIGDHSILVVKYAAGEKVEPSLLAYIYAHSLPDGILCLSDESLVGSIKALKQRGIRVPEQVRDRWLLRYAGMRCSATVPIVRQDFQRRTFSRRIPDGENRWR